MPLARGLTGLGAGMSMVVAILYLMRRSPAERRTRWANVYEGACIGGMSISSEMAGAIAAWRGWRWSFGLAVGVFCLAWLVAATKVAPGLRHHLEGGDCPAPPMRSPRSAPHAWRGDYLPFWPYAFPYKRDGNCVV